MNKELVWSGEHWISYLRMPGSDEHTGRLSLYHGLYSTAGPGTAAFVETPSFAALCTDSEEFARFIQRTMWGQQLSPFGYAVPIVAARFNRGGDVRRAPSWTLATADHRLTATWGELAPPLVGPPMINPQIVFTILVFAAAATLDCDGQPLPGVPYPREAWAQSLGSPMSSCCFALAETMVAPDQTAQ